eukprot:Transcript_9791.p2 GENE.Transcript_9791~~Transcript_9791.p2  ORF type:complete len:166 (-),score=37.38 Transcript_9791:385-882(-)
MPRLDPYHEPGALQEVVPSQPGLILACHDFCSPEETEALLHVAASSALQPPSAADKQPKKNEAYLDRDTCAFDDPALAAAMWARLRPLLPDVGDRTPVGFHGHDGTRSTGMPSAERAAKPLKYYRYVRGQRFGLHVDQSYKGANTGEETEYTMLLYLNSAGEPSP